MKIASTTSQLTEFSLPQSEIDETQVMIFAGGMGKRMGVDFPKALLQVDGRALLDRCIDFYANMGFTKFVLALGHRHKDILLHMEANTRDDIAWSYSITPNPDLGRAMSFRQAIRSGALDTSLRAIVTYPDDVFTDETLPVHILSEHIRATQSLKTLGSIVLTTGLKWPYGVAEVEEGGLVTKFVEKPVVSYPSSVGTYVLEPKVYGSVTEKGHQGTVELEQTVIPQLSRARKLYALFIPSECWLPINTQKDLEEAQKVLTRIHIEKRQRFTEPYPSVLTR